MMIMSLCQKLCRSLLTSSQTLHHGNWILHPGPKDIWSKHSGQILNTHFILTGVRLNLVQKPERDKPKSDIISTFYVRSTV